jgi:RimJ/RimL family protein N-acetyltransferase
MIATASIQVQPTRDFATLHSIMRHPAVWPFMTDDSSPAPETATLTQTAIYLMVFDQDIPRGFFCLQPLADHDTYMVHTVMMPGFRGTKALRAARQGMDWMFQNTPAEQIQSYCFEIHPEVMVFARWAGMRKVGEHVHPTTVSGKTTKVFDLLITREEWKRRNLCL